jgi:hypothetical protein
LFHPVELLIFSFFKLSNVNHSLTRFASPGRLVRAFLVPTSRNVVQIPETSFVLVH